MEIHRSGRDGVGDQNSNLNYHFTRYADVLLMHSEAVNNATGFSGSYDKYYGINLVRERAGLAGITNLDKDAFNKALIWNGSLNYATRPSLV